LDRRGGGGGEEIEEIGKEGPMRVLVTGGTGFLGT